VPGVNRRLSELGLELPPAIVVGDAVPFVTSGPLVFLTGRLPQRDGEHGLGKLGRELGVAEGRQAARLCGLALLAQLRAALGGDLDRVVRCVQLAGYVNATPDFQSPGEVIDAASQLLLEVFGDAGRHARVALAVSGLPQGAAVELHAIFESRVRAPWLGVRGLA
jgi:enamine deaminase RidA (YjgF/YER057c/UK114 family)